VRFARNGGLPGLWSGPGITSFVAAGRPLFGLAPVINRDEGGAPLLTSFAGVPLDANTVLVKYTPNGDTNLDGRVNISDYFRADAGRGLRRTGWENGDFDLDGGPADAEDYMLMDRAFLAQARAASVSPAPAAAAALWPEAPSDEDHILAPSPARVL
jgi:hypothetical protein